MLLALLSITVYMGVMYFIYFYKGFLPRTKKTSSRYEYHQTFDEFGDDAQPSHRPRQQQQQMRPGATMTRSMVQQTMLHPQQQQQQPIQDLRTRQFI